MEERRLHFTVLGGGRCPDELDPHLPARNRPNRVKEEKVAIYPPSFPERVTLGLWISPHRPP
jgi:hypothetical protein